MGAERCPYPVWSRICSPGLKRDVVEIRVLPVPLSLEPCLWSEPSGAELSSYCMIVTASGGQQWIASFLPCKYVLNVGVPQRCWYACASSTRKGTRRRLARERKRCFSSSSEDGSRKRESVNSWWILYELWRGKLWNNTDTLLHTNTFTDAFTHRDFYTQRLLHTDTFTRRRVYTQALLHADTCTHKHFHRHVYTQRLLHTEAFTHRHFYTQTLLHTGAFTRRCFYTQKLLHTDTFTHKRFCTQTLLYTDAFTHRGFYTQTLLHADAFTHTHTLSYTEAFTHRSFWRVSLYDILWSWTQTVLFLTSSTWWHRALLQTFADISLVKYCHMCHLQHHGTGLFWARYVGFPIIKWNNMCHTQHHGTELFWAIYVGFSILKWNDMCHTRHHGTRAFLIVSVGYSQNKRR